ncbi:MAG: copper resistance protein CopC [Labilithrix sp.]|nr:copper resistance protein CopC [Labilithrix sp.]
MLTRRSTLIGLAALTTSLLHARDAPATPTVVESSPPDGAVVARPPDRVVVRFSTEIESRGARIALVGPSGSSSLVFEGTGGPPIRELSIPLPDQGRGAYLVRWEIAASSGERIRGRLRFRVRE